MGQFLSKKHLALVSHLTSGSELCLIPEVAYNLSKYEQKFKREIRNGRRYFIAIVAEGIQQDSTEIARWFEEKIDIESRVNVLGHLQRGGNPSVKDRLMAYKFITYTIDGLIKNKNESVVCYTKNGFEYKDIDTVVNTPYQLDKELISFL